MNRLAKPGGVERGKGWVTETTVITLTPQSPAFLLPLVPITRRGATGPLSPDAWKPISGCASARQVTGHESRGPILIVDDDQGIVTLIGEILELEGYPFITAADGAEALRRIEEARPALVLLDMRMPILDGWEVARQLQAQESTVPILAMTAAQDARRWAEQIGAAGYLAKPFDLAELLAAVERLFPT